MQNDVTRSNVSAIVILQTCKIYDSQFNNIQLNLNSVSTYNREVPDEGMLNGIFLNYMMVILK